MPNPTIVVGQLNDEELKRSIDKLVANVDAGLNTMKQHTQQAVDEMQRTLKSLGNIKIDSGGAADGGSSRRTKAQHKETQAVNDTTVAYDKLAQAQQKATSSKKGIAYETMQSDVDKSLTYLINTNKDVDAQMDAILRKEQELLNKKQQEAQVTKEIADAAQRQIDGKFAFTNRDLAGTDKMTAGELRTAQLEAYKRSQVEAAKSNETFGQSIARLAGLQRDEIQLADAERDSYNKLSSTLKTLQAAYNNMTASERKGDKGKALLASIQEVDYAMQKIKREASRPVNLRVVMDLPTKTLDDIAYKIRQLQSYKMGINLTNPNAASEIRQVDNAIADLKKKMDSYMASAKQATQITSALTRSLNYMKNRLAFYFTVGASTAFVKRLIEIRGQYELLERSIGILIDSAQQGSRIFAELNAMAIKSPFTTMELGAAAKQLVAYDVAAKDVVDTTRRLADMAAAVGIPIERLTYALGQIKAYGYLNARDARMFANAGIPLVKELADRYTELEGQLVSVSDVYDRIKKKAISYEDVMDTVNKMTDEGGKFFNFQEKAADTLKVKIANLTLAWNNMLNEMGKDNQGLLSGVLVATKELFEMWRDIGNTLSSIVYTIGLIKAGQLVLLTATARYVNSVRMLAILQATFGKKFATTLANIGASFMNFVTNPAAMAGAAVGALAIALGKAVLDYRDLKEANEQFNKSISDNAKENIDSIDKFFKEYSEQLKNIDSASTSDQQKMWERLQEEIEKTTKNASDYLDVLNEIADMSARIKAGEAILEQSQVIEREAKRLADAGAFDIGGGFMDSPLADNIIKTEKAARELIQQYGSLYEAEQKLGTSSYANAWKDYAANLKETEKELDSFVSKLDNVDIQKIMGDNPSLYLSNIREFSNVIRDGFLATEKGQKITEEGQIRLNAALDQWIAKQAVNNGVITDRIINGKKYTAEEIANIEAQRTAWNAFFDSLNRSEKKRLDYLISTNQTGTKEFAELWDEASKNMQESNYAAYNVIQQNIENLRNTPDIIINVVYRERTEKETDKQRQGYRERYLTPKASGVLNAAEYFKQEAELTRKYGRYIKKEGEDNVEWEKRLGEAYIKNDDAIKKLNAQLAKSAKMSTVDKEAKEAELKTLNDQQEALRELEAAEGFNFEQYRKGKKGGSKKDGILAALKQEIDIVKRLQSEYDKLTKSGASTRDAFESIRQNYGKTIKLLNRELENYGLPQIGMAMFEGKDPNKIEEFFRKVRQSLIDNGLSELDRMKAVEAVIQEFSLSAKTYNLDKITKGLNNELGKLKDEYELAVELDANPELGGLFADLVGLGEDQLKDLPRDFDGVVKKLQSIVDQELGGGVFDVRSNLNKKAFESWVLAQGNTLDDNKAKALKAMIDYANKVRKDDTNKQIDEWNNLLEKYAEYEYKKKQIYDTYQREMAVARKKNAGDDIIDAITRRRNENAAKLDFEFFQKSPEWIVATGDLANLSERAIGTLIEKIEQYKKTAQHLSPKEIKQMNSALSKLYKEQRKGSPFKAVSNMLQEARERMATFDEQIQDTQKKIEKLQKQKKWNIAEGITDDELNDKLKDAVKRLEELRKARENVGKIDASQWVGAINEIVSSVHTAVNVFNDLAKAISGVDSNELDKAFSALEKAGQGAAIGAQIGGKSGGGYGALIGGIVGGATGAIEYLASVESAESEQIVRHLRWSEQAVTDLEIAYMDLEHAVDESYGTAQLGAKKAIIANKELQLAELQRQLVLEESRDSKDKDYDRIRELQKQIKELQYDIHDSAREIVNDLLGISSVGDAAEEVVRSMIEAFKKGEDYMKVYEESFEKMIDNIILKAIVGRVIGDKLDEMFNQVQERLNRPISGDLWGRSTQDIVTELDDLRHGRGQWGTDEQIRINYGMSREELYELLLKRYTQMLGKNPYDALDDEYFDILSDISEEAKDYGTYAKDKLLNLLGKFGIEYGQDSEKQLSSLQQGISGITEDTAGALESYMNIVSQRVFEQNEYIMQIRDVIVGLDLDVQVGTMAQILLQLQNSYIVQNAIKDMLGGWSNASGMAVRVEMV